MVLELARLLLAALFAVAAVAKLSDLTGSRRAMREFGVPARLAGVLAVAVALAELAIAAGLLPAATARVAAIAAAVLLAVFCAVVARAVLHGRRPDCHCFGQLHSAPAGWGVVGRNVLLAALALAVASRPAAAIGWLDLAIAVAATLVVGNALLSYVLLRRYGRALARIDELTGDRTGTEGLYDRPARLEAGAPAPAFELADLDGDRVALGGLLALGRPVLLVFSSPGCGACLDLLPQVARWQQRLDHATVALVSSGDRDLNAAIAAEHGLRVVLLQERDEVADKYGVEATPSAVLIGPDGRVERPLAAGRAAVEELAHSLIPDETPDATSAPARIALAAATAGAVAIAAASANAAPSTNGRTAQPTDPELRTIDAVLRKAEPRLNRSAAKLQKALRGYSGLADGRKLRTQRTALIRALDGQRRELLALRTTLERLPLQGSTALNVRTMIDASLLLVVRALKKQQRAVTAPPQLSIKLVHEAGDLLSASLTPAVNAGKLLGRGR